jgi:hypothetical protein
MQCSTAQRRNILQREELLGALIVSIGEAIESIGEDLQQDGFTGLAVKMEQLSKLRDAAFAAEGMRRL